MEEYIGKIKAFFGLNNCSVEITQNGVKAKIIEYHPLTPIENADCKVYFDALKNALEHKDVKNIAVTGPYGSGKSSMIRSFFANYNRDEKYKPITITLANFEANVNAKLNNNEAYQKPKPQGAAAETNPDSLFPNKGLSDFELEQLIERSIVQQLFYHEQDEKIPESHFKKIKKETWDEVFADTLYILLLVVSFVILLFPSFFWKLPVLNGAPDFIKELLPPLALLLAVIGLYKIIKTTRKLLMKISAMKFHVENAEIVLNKNENKSILNHYIDEIIYYFEETGKNIVILEDLDRFNRHEIFTKLREINYLVNNCEKVTQKVVFIYALRDDMFAKAEERTKFFDFIIPIIPIVNYSNSGEILRQKLTVAKKSEIKDPSIEIEDELIDSLSLFIDDMRLLFNIINEYKIYTEIKSKDKLNASRLLTMIVYKNLYPQDFVDLSQNKGLLYNAMEEVKPYKKRLIEQDEKKIAEIQAKIEQVENHDNSLLEKELRLVYLYQIINHLSGTFVCFIINKQRKNVHDVAEDGNLFKELVSQDKIPYVHNVKVNYPSGYFSENSTELRDFNFKNIEQEVNPDFTYEQRVALLNKTELNKLRKEISALESSIETYKQYSIYELLNHGDLKITNKDAYLPRQFDFVLLALQSGYINENYWEYTSIFHEGSITNSDQTFILNVKLHRKTPYDHKLQQVENVFRKLTKESERHLKYNESLNNDLMDYVLQEGMLIHTEPYINTAINNLDFVFQYIERGQHLNLFVNYLCQKWPLFIDFIVENKPDELDKYLRIILENTLTENLIPFFKGKTIYLNNYADFMLLGMDDDKKYELIDELDLRFEKLNPKTSPQDINYIYSNFTYSINIDVIRTILSSKEKWDEHAFNTKNYSYIKECYPEMAEYILRNVSDYIANVFLRLGHNTYIHETDFVELINSTSLAHEQKLQIIQKCKCKIDNITDINDVSLRNEICRQNKMAATWENVRAMMNENEDSIYTCDVFLNNMDNVQQLSAIAPLQEEQKLDDDMFYEIMCRNEIIDESYALLMSHANFHCSYFEEDEISETHMQILIDLKIVTASNEGFQYVKSKHPNLRISLLKHVKDFGEDYSKFDFDIEDIKLILQTSILDISEKQALLNNTSFENLLLKNDEVVQFVRQWLLSESTPPSAALKPKIMNLLAQNQSVSISERKQLYIKYSNSITEIKPFLKNLGKPYSDLIENVERVHIYGSDKQLLDALKRENHISKCKYTWNNRYYILRQWIHIPIE